MTDDYLTVNRANWDERAPAHAASLDYGFDRFASDPAHMSDVVAFDRPRLGDVAGLDALHLQCHIGTDTVSLARLGARVAGLDISPASLTEARRLSDLAGADIDFVESPVYEAVEALGGRTFDLVYTGIGALCWLPSVQRWAEVVSALLRPGGRLFLREGHPVLWSLEDEQPERGLAIEHPYFEHDEPSVWNTPGTYVETNVQFTNTTTHEWNHGLGEIVTAVLDAGLTLTALEEHDSVPWEALPGLMVQLADNPNEWQVADRPRRLPHTYTLQAVKPI